MKKILVSSILLLTLFILAYSFTGTVDSEPRTKTGNLVPVYQSEDCSHVHWSYKEGKEGPKKWTNLCTGFSACGGQVQSPINIETNKTSKSGALSSLQVNYGSTKVNIVNNGHTVKFGVTGNNTTTINGKEYKLLQFHYHAKSEHTIDGDHFPLEVHFVHQYSDTDFAVLGVMFKEGNENGLLKKYLSEIPTKEGEHESEEMIELGEVLPSNTDYFHYKGSLTTPPCSEVVNWYVLKTPLQASKEQLKTFAAILHGNFRPVMPLNDRKVLSFAE